MFCQSCGQQASEGTRFCPSCGKPLATPPRPSAPAPPIQPETSGKAIASLIFGIFSFIFPAAIVAIILGFLSRSQIRASAGHLKGEGMALAGIILGFVGVVFIPFILIIAAIAIPNLLQSRMAANEARAAASLRSAHTSLEAYRIVHGRYPATLDELASPPSGEPANLETLNLEEVLATKYGYVFEYIPQDTDGDGWWDEYTITAAPTAPRRTGRRYFFMDSSGTLRVETNRPAGPDSPLL